MAYKALYRTYRPQTFEDLAGQEHVTRTLQNAIKEGKIAHAYLFAGPRGTGKTTVAKLFAKAINCTGEHVPCNECSNCKAITTGDHPDVIEIDAASNNGVDEVRDLIDKVKYAPISGRYKVYIIDEVHMMSQGAFNALLKTLEEPPAHIVFILATTEPHRILPTIISRCQRFDFQRVENNDIIQRLQYVLDAENRTYEKDALSIIASLADGGMRDALSILEQCLAYNDELTVANINQVYGLLSTKEKINFIKLLLTKDMKGVLQSLDHMLNSSVDIKRLTFDIIDILKDIIIYKNTQDNQIMFVLRQDDLDSIVPYILVDEAFDMINTLVDASEHYSRSANGHTYFELAILKICNQIKEEHHIEALPIVEVKQQPVNEPITNNNVNNQTVQETIQEDIKTDTIEINNDKPAIIDEQPPYPNEEESMVLEEPHEVISNQVEEHQESVEIVFDDILNILVQAKKDVLIDIQEKWPVISRYQYNLNTAKFATMLVDGNVVAAGEKAFIVAFEYQPEVNNVNYSNNYHLLKKFLKEILGYDYDFIAVKTSEWPQIRNQFIQLKRNNQLPDGHSITLHHIHEYQEPEVILTEAQQTAIDMFGDIVEFKD